ncbi:MAG: hypothetical protein IJV00_07930 [Clostridia bacterium]|nr:hypothetical protein [Clostridia bacterium]
MHITDRLYNKKWGVFFHYLQNLQNNPANPHNQGTGVLPWDECVNALDVHRLAETLNECGAGYCFITVMQGDPYLIAPNRTFDSIAGTLPGQACAKRDLIADLFEALSPYGIDLYLYYTGDGPYKDPDIGSKFGFTSPRSVGVTLPFVKKWSAVLEEYAVRYGKKVCGWWIDGCYRGYFRYTDELLEFYRGACKKGNPDALVAMNNGVFADFQKNCKDEDFVCGEFNDFTAVPPSRFIDGAQAFVLAPLGVTKKGAKQYGAWGCYGCKRSGEYLKDYVSRVNAAGGVVTIDAALNRDGSLDPEQVEALKKIDAGK